MEMNHEVIMKVLRKMERTQNELINRLNTLLIEEYETKEVAAELGVSESFVYKLSKERLPFIKRGKKKFYRKEDVLKYKKSREITDVIDINYSYNY